ncbi:MAG: hypothetical protein KAI74_05405 [Kiritimatiellae bacterium]|nr:hypothetical protein [Kiritimatiellia bacterium]
MKVALITSGGRMAPCFAGNELFIYDDDSGSGEHVVIDTAGWELRDWTTELIKYDIDQLLCAGIGQFLSGALFGNGIVVISNIVGVVDEVLEKWRQGLISDQQEYGLRRRRCGHRGNRCRNNG